ncbi:MULTISPECIES: YigZ family protein [Bhargavaea]|uniref:YigZ family protein n=1 Tax=Bhargavaea changchunensis TaxID=2134037 RepID=A0ABW2NI18_9BACL|nr:YigZ family protein [Bhargavaea sp. CC-171006]
MRDDYRTVKGNGESELIIKKSRFIGHVARAESEEDAMSFIAEIKQAHHSATHNCSAYLIGEHDQIQKANDDGEPSGTAGVPMLEVLKKQNLKDTVVVVTRYFGGIKLGGGGLIRAYGSSVSDVLSQTGIVERRLHHLMKVTIDYTWLGKVENELHLSAYPLDRLDYAEAVSVFVYVPAAEEDKFRDWIANLTNGQAVVDLERKEFLEFDV